MSPRDARGFANAAGSRNCWRVTTPIAVDHGIEMLFALCRCAMERVAERLHGRLRPKSRYLRAHDMAYEENFQWVGGIFPVEMESAILINGSKVQPRLAILKPQSSAIAIGSGGPFGAEGPIIMTGGAIGSVIGPREEVAAAAVRFRVLSRCSR
jgi:hypothetical protein